MATIKKMKKAQDGDKLRRGQYKRLGRIAEKNPLRAERVAERMNERASRVSRGKDIAGDSETGNRSVKDLMYMLYSPTEARQMEKARENKKPMKNGGKTKMKKAQTGYDSALKADAAKPAPLKLGYTAEKSLPVRAMHEPERMYERTIKEKQLRNMLQKSNRTENPRKYEKRSSMINKANVLEQKMKNGGSLSGLKASNKRVGPIDPKGAYTKVQKKTLAGAKGKASLTKDKQLGATKMKMGGKSKKR